MMYQAVKYNSKNEALSAFKKMVERKRERVENAQRELDQIAKYRIETA